MTGVHPVIVARRVFERHRLSIPVRPELVAAELGIPIEVLPLSDGLSGLLVPEIIGQKTHYMIIVNRRHRKVRRRFSIAHELGHFFLHRGAQVAFTSHDRHRRSQMEREANEFAAELLMPKKLVLEASSLNDIQGLTDYFGVSTVAMRRRLLELEVTA